MSEMAWLQQLRNSKDAEEARKEYALGLLQLCVFRLGFA